MSSYAIGYPGGPVLLTPPTRQILPPDGRPSISFETHGNDGYSTVAVSGAPSPATTGTTLTLTAATTFPSPNAPGSKPYIVGIWPVSTQPTQANQELALCTAIDYGTNVMTLVRAQEGSTARTVIDGDQVALVHSAKAMTDVEAAVLALDSRLNAVETTRTLATTALTLVATDNSSRTTTSTSYVDLGAAQLTIPVNAIYRINFVSNCFSAGGSATGTVSVAYGGVAASDANGVSNGNLPTPGAIATSVPFTTTLFAGALVKLQYKVDTGTGGFLNTVLTVTLLSLVG